MFIIMNICCFFLLIIVLPFRVTQYVFNYDPTQLSLAWCKIRQAIVQAFSLMSFSAICFAAIDQYLSTSYSNQLRQMSTFKLAQRLVGILIIFTIIYCIPVATFYEIRLSSGCTTYNPIFNYIYRTKVFSNRN